MNSYLYALFVLLLSSLASAQTVTGIVLDQGGQPLPYVTVGEENEGIGATTNLEGVFSIVLNGQGGELTFRYVGYEVLRKRIAPGEGNVALDVILVEATYELAVAVVSSNAEDPAYRIMREAAARREQYLLDNNRYEADVYVKSLLQFDKTPEKVFGQELGDLDGLLDSSRAGIIYLSETYSKIYVEQPDKFYEEITASKISGDAQGYAFGTAEGIEFELYQKQFEFEKLILSPLAENAPNTYRFKLEGSHRNNEGKIIYRIAVTPRQPEVAAYHGIVFIEDESYHLLNANLFLLGGPLASPGLDTLFINQGYREREGKWEVYQRQIRLRASVLGFEVVGAFTAVYESYAYEPEWDTSPFTSVKTRVLAESNKVDSTIWEGRPIPLSQAETRDYVRKDSIERVRNSPVYKDSVQQARNKVNFSSILGYSHSNWRTRTTWRYALANDVSYHPVSGVILGATVGYTKVLDEDEEQAFSAKIGANYGFGDKKVYPNFETSFRFDKLDRQKLTLRAGRELKDIHRANPVSYTWNSLVVAFTRKNPLKLYERRVIELTHDTKLRQPGTRSSKPPVASLTHLLRYEDRVARVNTSSFSLFNRNREVQDNLPLPGETGIVEEDLLIYAGALSFTPKEKFTAQPDRYISLGSSWPTFNVNWRFGASLEEGGLDRRFAVIGLSARKDALPIGRAGLFSARIAGATQLLNDQQVPLVDQLLFAGNPILVNSFPDYLTRFLALDPYDFATDGSTLEAMFEHNFNGALWSRIPVLNELRWEVLVRGAALVTSENENGGYQELGVGLSNLGVGLARFVRVDAVWSHDDNGWNKAKVVLGINISLSDLGSVEVN